MENFKEGILQSELNVAIEKETFNLFTMLKPKLYVDGNLWYVLYGSDLLNGISGSGNTPLEAIIDWNKAWTNR